MPKCVVCNKFFPPNYTEIVEGSQPDPLNFNEYPQNCIFCKLGIDKVERETAKLSGKYVMYSKEECLRDYKEFLIKLKENRNLKDILNKEPSRIKI